MNQNHKSDLVIADCLHIARRYARSVQIERDYRDPQSIEGYVVTPTVQYAIGQLIAGLKNGSSQRAWRVTGPYGAGKSAFGLFAANLISRSGRGYQKAISILKDVSKELATSMKGVPHYLPVPVTGSRARFSDVLLANLIHELETERTVGRNPAVVTEVKKYQQQMTDGHLEDTKVIELITDFAIYIKRSSLPYDGILILIDEMGKFLEYAAIRPNKADAFLFQRLGELASGSSEVPLAVIGFLHHQFADYAIGYGQRAEEEWAKVSERFEEIPFDESPEQYAFLLTSAIQNDKSLLDQSSIANRAQTLYQRALEIGVSVTAKRNEDLIASAASLYPIHPATLVVLSAGIKRFGQNERSLFSFLLSHEPFAFQQFISITPFHPDRWYRLSNLFDYLASIGALRFRDGDRRRRWDYLRNTLIATPGLSQIEQDILKAVGLINVLGPMQEMQADEKTIAFCICDRTDSEEISEALLSLLKKGILYQRSMQRDYCLWSNTSIDLSALYEEAERRVPPIADLETFLEGLPQARPAIAHRHYHRTGTLRAFGIRYATRERLEHHLIRPDLGGFDGQIIVVPVGLGEDFDQTSEVVRKTTIAENPRILVHLLEVTPADLSIARELRLWQWIQSNCLELRVDEFARSEVKKRLDELSSNLEQRLSSFLVFEDAIIGRRGRWFYQSQELDIPDRKALNQNLTEICDELYHASPIIRNELINRARLSSSIASARTRLIAGMIENQKSEHLDIKGTPPELAIYLTVFHASGLHRNVNGMKGFCPPADDDPCNWKKAWHDLRTLLKEVGEIQIETILNTLGEPPYGIRQGVSILFLTAFLLHYRHDVSLFERGTYVVQITEHHFMRLIKSPRTFALHFVPTEPEQANLIHDYWAKLDVLKKRFDKNPEVTDVVRELYRWATSLSSYALKIQKVAKTTRDVRAILLKSSDPMDLLYEALPKACGMGEAFSGKQESNPDLQLYFQRLNNALNELSQADRHLRSEVEHILIDTLQLGENVEELRQKIRDNYLPYARLLSEYRLKTFLTRASEAELSDEKWIDSMASLLAGKILPHWQDDTVAAFHTELRSLAGQMKRWIALTIGHTKGHPSPQDLVSVTITNAQGHELALPVLKKGTLPGKLERLKEQVKSVLSKDIANAPVLLAQLLAEIMDTNDHDIAEGITHGSAPKTGTPHS